MAKKYPLTTLYLFRNKKMEITFGEKELAKVIEAGLEAIGYTAGTILSMDVTQSRKTGKASLTLEVDPFNVLTNEVEPVVTEEPKVEKTIEPVEAKTEQLPEVVQEVEPEPVIEQTIVTEPEPVVEEVKAPVESASLFDAPSTEDADNLFATPVKHETAPKQDLDDMSSIFG